MPKYFLICFVLCIGLIGGCDQQSTSDSSFEVDERPLVEKIKSTESNLEVPPGATTAERLLYTMQVDQTFKSMMLLMNNQMLEIVKVSKPDVSINTVQHYQEIGADEVENMLPEIIAEMSTIYENHFTEDEMEVMINFYEGDVGQKFVSRQNLLMADGAELGQSIGTRLQARIQARIAKEEK